MKYGVLDTKDNVWMGNKEGPLLYDAEELAQVAARIVDARLCNPAGRCKAMLYAQDATTLKDELTCQRSAEEAIALLERGRIL